LRPDDMLEYVLLSFKADRRRALMSSLGIIIGVVSIVALLSVGQGLYGGVNERFGDLDMDLVIVRPGSGMGMGPGDRPASAPEEPAEFDERDVKIIDNVVGVEAVYPLKTSRTLLSFRGDNASVSVIGISPDEHDDLKDVVARGRFLANSDYKAAVVSHDVAENFFRMDISPGNKIRLYQKEEDRYLDFKVVGVLEEDEDPSYASDTGIYITHRAMKDFLDIEEYHYASITVKVENAAQVEVLAEEIKKELARIHRDEAYNVEAMTTRFESVLEVLNMIKYALAGIGSISLIVGRLHIFDRGGDRHLQRHDADGEGEDPRDRCDEGHRRYNLGDQDPLPAGRGNARPCEQPCGRAVGEARLGLRGLCGGDTPGGYAPVCGLRPSLRRVDHHRRRDLSREQGRHARPH